jgi:hypothetical protein
MVPDLLHNLKDLGFTSEVVGFVKEGLEKIAEMIGTEVMYSIVFSSRI